MEKQKQTPKVGDFIYVKNIKSNRVVFCDEISSVNTVGFITSMELSFDFDGTPLGRTTHKYKDCRASVCDEESAKFYSRLYTKNYSHKKQLF